MEKLAELYERNRERFVKFGHAVEPYVLITVFVFFGVFVGMTIEQYRNRQIDIDQEAAHVREIQRIGDTWREAYMLQGRQVGQAAEATANAAERVAAVAGTVKEASATAASAARNASIAAVAAGSVSEVSRKDINTSVQKANRAVK
jgi:hypothetical protein